MVELGYAISSEEHAPQKLIENARLAEQAGFAFASISDHFHPWIPAQGHSPFVWSILGGISQATERIRVFTNVTCPIIRIHPAIIAQAAATTASLFRGRFMLGLGTGENLNEHVTGEAWPPYGIRAEMFEEAVEIIRMLWQGGNHSFYGTYYDVVNAEIYTLPEQLPPILIAAAGPESAEMAGQIGDGLINTKPDKEVVDTFNANGNANRPKYGQVTVCWGKDEKSAAKTALQWWPTAALKGPLNTELPLPQHFEESAQDVTEEDMMKAMVCGNDPKSFIETVQEYVDAGFDHVYVHQIGPDQAGFIDFFAKHVMPEFQREKAR